jgi:hypothetical protein
MQQPHNTGSFLITIYALAGMFSTLRAQTSEPVAGGDNLRTAMTLGDLASVQKLIANGADRNIPNPRLNGGPFGCPRC